MVNRIQIASSAFLHSRCSSWTVFLLCLNNQVHHWQRSATAQFYNLEIKHLPATQPIHLFHHSNFCHCKNPDSHRKGAGTSPKGNLVQHANKLGVGLFWSCVTSLGLIYLNWKAAAVWNSSSICSVSGIFIPFEAQTWLVKVAAVTAADARLSGFTMVSLPTSLPWQLSRFQCLWEDLQIRDC